MRMTHELALECAYGRRIPPGMRALARSLDRIGGLAVPERPAGEIRGELAQAIIDRVTTDGTCSFDDLAQRGFSTLEIAAHGEFARQLAAEAIEHRRNHPPPKTTFAPARRAGARPKRKAKP